MCPKIPEKKEIPALWCFLDKSKYFNIELTNRSSLAPENFNRVGSLSSEFSLVANDEEARDAAQGQY